MPYVRKDIRGFLNAGNAGDGVGELTYSLQHVLLEYLENILCPPSAGYKEGVGRDLTYDDLIGCVKALEGARIDFEDRILLPYERRKRAENGDVWPKALLDHIYGGRAPGNA